MGTTMDVDGDFANFRSSYDFYTDEVERSSAAFLHDHLRNWFRTLDTTRDIAPLIDDLQAGLDFDDWNNKREVRARLGSAALEWPDDPQKALGMKLLLFRSVASPGGGERIAWMGRIYIPSRATGITPDARRFIEQVFGPMARELRRYLESNVGSIPAADRTVTLKHNSAEYQETVEAGAQLERGIIEANDFESVEERDRLVAEVSAVRRLLQATRIRVAAVVELLRPLVEQTRAKLKDRLLGMAVAKFIALLGALIGYIWALF